MADYKSPTRIGFKKEEARDSKVSKDLTTYNLKRQQEDIGSYKEAIEIAEQDYFPNRQALYRIYKRIEMDAVLKDARGKRARAIKNSNLQFILNKDKSAHEGMQEVIETPWFRKLLQYRMDSISWGYTVVEPILNGREIVNIKRIPYENLNPDRGLIHMSSWNTISGFPINEKPWSDWLLPIGEVEDFGLYFYAVPLVLYKSGNWADWAQFNELFGMPIRQYTYNPADPESRAEAKAAAEQSGSALALIVPQGVGLELKDGANSATGALYDTLRKACNEELLILYLGQTLTTTQGNGTGSYALGEVHQDVLQDVFLEDLTETEFFLNFRFKSMLEKWGYPVKDGYFKFDTSVQLPLDKQLEMDLKVAAKVPVADEYFYERYGLPKPEAGKIVSGREGNTPAKNDKEEGGEKDDESDGAAVKAEATGCLHITNLYNPASFVVNASVREMQHWEDELVKAIWDRNGVKYDRATWEHNRKRLVQGLNEGLGKINIGYESRDMIQKAMMEANIFRFGYDKTLAQVYELNRLRKSEEGASFSKFKQNAAGILDKFNVNYLRTEYNLTTSIAQNAAAFNRAKQDGMRYVMFKTVGDGNVRDEHAALDGMVFSLDDTEAAKFIPPIDWGCRCEIIFLKDYDGEVSTYPDLAAKIDGQKLERMERSGFMTNWGNRNEVFGSNMSYVNKLVDRSDFTYTQPLQLGPAENNLPLFAAILKKELPQADLSLDKAGATELFRQQSKNRVATFRDARGYELFMQEKRFKAHLDAAKSNIENRAGLSRYMKDAIASPDEVYLTDAKGKYTFKYVKFYKDHTVVVITELSKEYGYEVVSWFDGNVKFDGSKLANNNVDKNVRRGLLIYRK